MTAEQQARDMLERMGVDGAQNFSAGELVELANLIAAVQWQPIETAPRDGRRVLVWIDEKHQKGCAFAKLWWYESGRLGGGAEGYNGDWNITRWMPLPAAPKE